MFGKRIVEETRFVTKDEQGLVELWQSKPSLIHLVGGETIFDDPHNQISLDAPVNKAIAGMFALPINTCLKVEVVVSKNKLSVKPLRSYDFSREREECSMCC